MAVRVSITVAIVAAMLLAGCAAPQADFSKIERPERAAELDAYETFVGTWAWKATQVGAEGADAEWSGSAEWEWSLDKRCLRGHMVSRGAHAEFESEGIWSRHPKSGKYTWWMFNNWGYPQDGTAAYDEQTQTWRMPYTSIGLDGTRSYGSYTIRVVDADTLDWTMVEWADALHAIKKIELTGTYTRK